MNPEQFGSGSKDEPADDNPRIRREKRTFEAMVKLYCRHHHTPQETLCSTCEELVEYAKKRLDQCPFQERKPTCAKCTIHCYVPVKREIARTVMRYSGPRMLWHHPIMALHHLLDTWKS